MFNNLGFDTKRLWRYILIAIIIIFVLLLNFYFIRDYMASNSSQIKDYALQDEDINPTREAAVAGVFYPADVYQLEQKLNGYLEMVAPRLGRRPHIMIVPHAGYMYSAEVAAKAYQQLLPFADEIKKVIILGPSHKVPLKGVGLSTASSFNTPFGKIKVNEDITRKLALHPLFKYNDRAHRNEHALEVQLPFLQKTLKSFTIIPMVYGNVNHSILAQELLPLIKNNDTLLVVSADLSHYLNDDKARQIDKQTAQMISDGIIIDEHRSCGAIGINTAMAIAKQLGFKPQLLDMANSGDVSGETDRVVGYASWVFAGAPEPEEKLSPLEQEVKNINNFVRHNRSNIVQIVKRALDAAVLGKKYKPSREEYPDIMFDKGAAFVTLKSGNKLRGCIGSLLPTKAIALDLASNTYLAAIDDKRFEPISAKELTNISFSISILSGYERIRFKSEADLLNKITPYKDGLVLRDGYRQGVFLPSVWEQFSTPAEFLNNLKIKAGLSPSYWSDNVKIYRFRTVEIKEQ